MADLYEQWIEKIEGRKAFFFTDEEGRVRFAGGPGAGGGSGGGGGSITLGNGQVVKIGDTVYPRGRNEFKSTLVGISSRRGGIDDMGTLDVILDVGSRAGTHFITDVADTTIIAQR